MDIAARDGESGVTLPEDFSLYAKRIGLLSHSIAAVSKGNGTVRVVCSSNSNKDFLSAEGDLFRIGLRVNSPYYKPGKNRLYLTNQNLTVRDNAQKYVPRDTFRLFSIDEGMVSVRLTVSAAQGYSTCVLPFSADLPAGLKAYECAYSEGDTLFLNTVDHLEAYTPYIIYARGGFQATLSGMTSAADYERRVDSAGIARSGLLCGALSPQSVSEGYVLTLQEGNTVFLNTGGQEYMVPAGKCWIETPAARSVSAYVMMEDGLQQISDAAAQERSGVSPTPTRSIYDLQGRRLLVPQRGINIVGGKKVVY